MQTSHLNLSAQMATIWPKVHQTDTNRLRCKPCILTCWCKMETCWPNFAKKNIKRFRCRPCILTFNYKMTTTGNRKPRQSNREYNKQYNKQYNSQFKNQFNTTKHNEHILRGGAAVCDRVIS